MTDRKFLELAQRICNFAADGSLEDDDDFAVEDMINEHMCSLTKVYMVHFWWSVGRPLVGDRELKHHEEIALTDSEVIELARKYAVWIDSGVDPGKPWTLFINPRGQAFAPR